MPRRSYSVGLVTGILLGGPLVLLVQFLFQRLLIAVGFLERVDREALALMVRRNWGFLLAACLLVAVILVRDWVLARKGVFGMTDGV